MKLDFYTLEQAIKKISEVTKEHFDYGNIADLTFKKELKLLFYFEGSLGLIDYLDSTLSDSTIKNVSEYTEGYLEPIEHNLYSLINGDVDTLNTSIARSKLDYSAYVLLEKLIHPDSIGKPTQPLHVCQLMDLGIQVQNFELTRNKLRISADSLYKYLNTISKTGKISISEEISYQKAIAIMSIIVAQTKGKFKSGERPNAKNISKEINDIAKEEFAIDIHGLKSFEKKISHSLKEFENELPSRIKKI